MKPTRLFDFKAGTPARSAEVDAEFNQIIAILDGKLGDDNLLTGGISPDKLKDRLASNKFRGSSKTFSDLAVDFPDAKHMDMATIDDSLELYTFDNGTKTWKLIGSVQSTPSHNTLINRNSPDAHNISAITGLQTALDNMNTAIGNIPNFGDTISNHELRIQTVETDVNSHSKTIANGKEIEKNLLDYVQGGEDITTKFSDILQRAIDDLHKTYKNICPVLIRVPAKLLHVTKTIYLRSNVHIDFGKAVLKRMADINALLVNGRDDGVASDVGLYARSSNIALYGGTIDANTEGFVNECSTIVFGHASRITIEGITFKGKMKSWHYIELNSTEYGAVRKCRFTEYLPGAGPSGAVASEAVQIDLAINQGAFPWYGPWDFTVCRHVTVENNEFIGVHDGVGSHSSSATRFHDHIIIKNNRFVNLTGIAVKTLKYRNVQIIGNDIDSCYNGIQVESRDGDATENITISHNTIYNISEGTPDGRAIYSKGLDGSYNRYVVIANNNINKVGRHGMSIDYNENAVVQGNNIANCGWSGIWLYASKYSQVIQNNVTNTGTLNNTMFEIQVGVANIDGALVLKNVVANNVCGRIKISNSTSTMVLGNYVLLSSGLATEGTIVNLRRRHNMINATWEETVG